jgi:hypothetical protein
MGFFFFIYTLIIMVTAMIVGILDLSAFRISGKKTFAIAGFGFVFYFLDELPIFAKDFLTQTIADPSSLFYGIYEPGYMMVTGGGFLFCIWLVVCALMDERRTAMLFVPPALFAVFSVLALVLTSSGGWHQFAFYIVREVFLLWIAGYAFAAKRFGSPILPKSAGHFPDLRSEAVVLGILTLGMILEDIVFMLLIDPSTMPIEFTTYATERNFIENIMFFWLSVISLRMARRELE